MIRPLNKRKKKTFRIPIAVHIYSSLIFITFLTVVIFGLSSTLIFRSYVESECVRKINSAVKSCTQFSEAFRASSQSMGKTQDEIRENLLNAIVTSADFSSDASIVLFDETAADGTDEADGNNYNVLWPNASYSVNAYIHTDELIDSIIASDGLNIDSTVHRFANGSDIYYYKFIGIEYSDYPDQPESEYEKYYLLIYTNANSYLNLFDDINNEMATICIVSIIASAVISIIVSMPIYSAIKKLSLFSQRIGKGDFKPLKQHIISRELQDLGDSMNSMAKKLENSGKEQQTFFQNASHELRTPLMSIQGYAEGIKYDIFDEESKANAIDVIISETTRMSNLVENLLTISKMDMAHSGSYEVKKQTLSVLELADIVLDKVRGSFLLEGKDLINNVDISDSFILGNENDLIRMLENILSNGLRYAKTCVSFECTVKDGKAVFTICDDGAGISPEVQKHLFDRFAKGDDGKHGIGLSLAKAIAEEHNGTIAGFNNENGGACFEIKLPLINPRRQLSDLNNSYEE